ncbi:hypothetical protein Tco_0434850, partial [Tanacetum coccineum]
MLTSKWATLNTNCQRFNAIHKHFLCLGKSGVNGIDVLTRAKKTFKDEFEGRTFTQESSWEILRHCPKWDAPDSVPTVHVEGETVEGNVKLFAKDKRPGLPGARSGKKTKSESTSSTSGSNTSVFRDSMYIAFSLKRDLAQEKASRCKKKKYIKYIETVRRRRRSYVSILKSGKTNNIMSDHILPSLILDDSCISDRYFSLSLMGKVKDITNVPNLYVIMEKEGFQNLSLAYLGGLWVLIETAFIFSKEKLLNHTGVGSWFSSPKSACNSFVSDERVVWISLEGFPLKVRAKEMEACDPFICNDSYKSESSDDEEDAEDNGSQSRDKVTTDNDVERVKWATSNEVNEHVNSTSNKLEEFIPKGKLSSNNSVCSKRVHTGGSILQLMDELVK